tara:strand:+ start:65 stop:460 length:396 start_codon:yes stop_codon:yes gene_type:complete
MAGKDKKQKRTEKTIRRKVKKIPEPEIKQDPEVPSFPRGEAISVRGSGFPANIDRVGSPTTGTAASLKNFYEDVDMNEYAKKQLKDMEKSGVGLSSELKRRGYKGTSERVRAMKLGGAVMNGRGPKFKGQT